MDWITDATSIIDLGCGTAFISRFCRDKDYRGADLPHIIKGCAMHNHPEYLYKAMDILNDDITFSFFFLQNIECS